MALARPTSTRSASAHAGGDAWESLDYGTAASRVDIEIRGGIGSFSVR